MTRDRISGTPDDDVQFFMEHVQNFRERRGEHAKSTSRPLSGTPKPHDTQVKACALRARRLRIAQFNPLSPQKIARLRNVVHQLGRTAGGMGLRGTQLDGKQIYRESYLDQFTRFHWGRKSRFPGHDRADGVELFLRRDLFSLGVEHHRYAVAAKSPLEARLCRARFQSNGHH